MRRLLPYVLALMVGCSREIPPTPQTYVHLPCYPEAVSTMGEPFHGASLVTNSSSEECSWYLGYHQDWDVALSAFYCRSGFSYSVEFEIDRNPRDLRFRTEEHISLELGYWARGKIASNLDAILASASLDDALVKVADFGTLTRSQRASGTEFYRRQAAQLSCSSEE